MHPAPLPTVLHAMDALNVPPPSPAQYSTALFLAGSHQFLCNSIISIEPGQALILKAVTPSNFIQLGGVWTMDYDSPLHCTAQSAQPRSDCFPKHWPFVLSWAGAGQRGHYGQVAPTLQTTTNILRLLSRGWVGLTRITGWQLWQLSVSYSS